MNSLEGAIVFNKNTSTYSYTNLKGRYSIVANKNDTLQYSYVGMQTFQKTVNNNDTINVSLEIENILNEITITALGYKKNRKSTGYAIQNLSDKDITTVKRQNLTNSLSGKIAGVNIVNSSGAVGAESRITIRGISSISGNDQPLIIVDNVCLLYTSPSPRDA